MGKERLYVLAGNHKEFLEYLQQRKLKSLEVCYLGSYLPRGLRDIHVIRIGTWWKNPVSRDPMLKIIEAPLEETSTMNLTARVIGRKLRKAREQRGLSVRQVAESLDMDISNYRKLELGTKEIRLSGLIRVLNVLKIPLEKFWRIR